MQKDVLKYNPLSQTEFKYLLKEIKKKKKKKQKKKKCVLYAYVSWL